MNRFVPLALACLLLFGCGSSEKPYSEYFIVTFVPATAEPSEEGRAALANAAHEVRRSLPTAVLIESKAISSGASEADEQLRRQRETALEQALRRAGVEPALIRTSTRRVDEKEYPRSGNAAIIQFVYGSPPAS